MPKQPAKKKKLGRPKGTKNKVKYTRANEIEALKALVKTVEPPKSSDAIEGEVIQDLYDRFGRPTVMTNEVKDKIIEAFSWGCTKAEAALHAGISERTITNYNKADPEFKEYCLQLKESPVLSARATVVRAIKNNPFYALKFLERKRSDEFSVRVIQSFQQPQPLTEEQQKLIDDVIDENL